MKNFIKKSAFAGILFFGISLFTPSFSQELRNASGSQTGKIDSDGTVRNSSGSKIGSASGMKKEWAAVTFFFY